MYILAGKKKLADVRANELKAAQEKAQRTQLPEDAQAARDLADMCDRFEKKLYDLELTRKMCIRDSPTTTRKSCANVRDVGDAAPYNAASQPLISSIFWRSSPSMLSLIHISLKN